MFFFICFKLRIVNLDAPSIFLEFIVYFLLMQRYKIVSRPILCRDYKIIRNGASMWPFRNIVILAWILVRGYRLVAYRPRIDSNPSRMVKTLTLWPPGFDIEKRIKQKGCKGRQSENNMEGTQLDPIERGRVEFEKKKGRRKIKWMAWGGEKRCGNLRGSIWWGRGKRGRNERMKGNLR